MTRRTTQRGFTMIEVLVALALAGIAMSGLLVVFGRTTEASRYARRATEATVLAQDQLERLRASGTTGTGTAANIDASGHGGGVFTRTWTVVEGAAYADMTCTVSWDDDGTPRSLTVRTRRNR